jgi:hypothetical protein
MGLILIVFAVILLVVLAATRGKTTEPQETFGDWDFADLPDEF